MWLNADILSAKYMSITEEFCRYFIIWISNAVICLKLHTSQVTKMNNIKEIIGTKNDLKLSDKNSRIIVTSENYYSYKTSNKLTSIDYKKSTQN